jgi:signal transduction histidine kinase
MTQLEATSAAAGVETDKTNKTWPVLHGRLHTAVRLIWIGWAIVAFAIFIASLPAYLSGASPHESTSGVIDQLADTDSSFLAQVFDVAGAAASISAALVSFGLATLLFLRKSDDGMAMFVSILLLTYGVVLAGPLERFAIVWPPMSSWVMQAQTILLATPILLLTCLFPSGRFVPRWTRWLIPVSLLWIVLFSFMPPLEEFSTIGPATVVGLVVIALSLPVFGIYAQIYRYRRESSPEEKQQTKWVVYGLGLWFAWIIISSIPYMVYLNQPEGTPQTSTFRVMGLMWWLAMNIVPISLTFSVMRYRLWDIDLVVNRTLVYGSLTAIVVAIYVLIVGGLGAIFQTQGSLLVSLFATGLIAVFFQPVRARVQQGVNRLVYGERDDPVTALSRLGKRLEATLAAEDVLPTLVENVAEILKLPYTAIGLEGNMGYQIVAEYGIPTDEVVEFPLVYHAENIGRLLVAPRSPTESFNPADMQLLSNIANQAGAALHGMQLTMDLRRSQQQLVSTREEERRRLRRDIHDGLGPSLAAYMLSIGSARALLPENPETADQLLAKLETDLESTLKEIRRLVYNLRPPELDQLGLVGAITRYAAQFGNGVGPESQSKADGLVINIRASESLPSLSAAVEAAAYRITQEAVSNVVRYAHARNCELFLDFTDALLLTISDDGIGMPIPVEAGVGMSSMRERAFELGGTCKVISAPGSGTRIEVILPMIEPANSLTMAERQIS